MANSYENNPYDFPSVVVSGNTKRKAAPQPVLPQKNKGKPLLEIPQSHYARIYRGRRRKKNRSAVFLSILIAVGVIISSFLIVGQVQLAELTTETENAQTALEESQSLYTQLQMETDAQVSMSEVENYAVTQLGMTKETQTQMNYVELSSEDKGEVIQSDEENWIGAVWNYLVGLLS